VKLIEQLIDYLRSRGALTADQLAVLARKGFIDLAPEAAAEPARPPERPRPEPEWDEAFRVRPARAGGKRKARRARKELGAEELAAGLAKRFPDWESALAGLTGLGRRLGPCAGWRDAADAVLKHDAGARAASLISALRDGALSADQLWGALHFEEYRAGLDARSGAAGNAYRALLSGSEVSAFTKHAWLLKTDEAAAVYRLVRAQKALARAVAGAYRDAPEVIRRGLRRGESAQPLAILEAALWAAAPGRIAPEHARFFALPPGHQPWWRAWSLALEIDPEGAAALLARCRTDPFVPAPADQVPGELRRFAFTADELDLEEKWFDALSPDGSVRAAVEQLVPADGPQGLEGFRAGLRHPLPTIRRRALARGWSLLDPVDLAPLLADPVWDLRCAAIERILGPEAGRALGEALTGPRPELRDGACRLLATWGRGRVDVLPGLRPALSGMLADPEPDASVAAARAFGRFGDPAAVPDLISALDHVAPATRAAAAAALGEIGTPAGEVVTTLLRAAADPDPAVRGESLRALGVFAADDRVAPALIGALGDAAPRVRDAAVEAMARLESVPDSATPLLMQEFLGRYSVRAGELLKRVRSVALLPHLPELILLESVGAGIPRARVAGELLEPILRRPGDAVAEGLHRLTVSAVEAGRLAADTRYVTEGLPRLVERALTEPGTDVGRRALEVAGALGSPVFAVLSALSSAIEGPWEISLTAERLLGELARTAEELLPSVLRGLSDPKQLARSAAAELLRWVGPAAVAARPLQESSFRRRMDRGLAESLMGLIAEKRRTEEPA
jgi:HEAT repeat protein